VRVVYTKRTVITSSVGLGSQMNRKMHLEEIESSYVYAEEFYDWLGMNINRSEISEKVKRSR